MNTLQNNNDALIVSEAVPGPDIERVCGVPFCSINSALAPEDNKTTATLIVGPTKCCVD